jgi:hypothetical protein
MSVFNDSNEVKVTHESAVPKIAFGALAVGGAVGTAYFGAKFANEAFNNKDNLRNAGIALLSATGFTFAMSKLNYRVRSSVDSLGARRVFGLGGILGAALISASFIATDRDSGTTELSVDKNISIEADVIVKQESREGTPTDSIASSSAVVWPCEIYAPIQSGNGSPENIGSAVALQRFLVTEVGFPEDQVNGNAGSPTGDYVDIYQEKVGIDVSLPWGPETCAVSPFGDGDSSTPASGGWETNWEYYLENIATTE